MNVRLSVLDQSPILQGSSIGDALRNTIDLAVKADSWGYRRFWLAEHHAAASLACASPEALIGPVAAATKHLRVGSGGVMLPHYSALKVGETFGMLAGLYPGRIDLGIGRAAGTTPRVAFALQRDRRHAPPDDFPEQFAELQEYFATRQEVPEVWLLGSSEQSAIWASEWKTPYAFADFINPHGASFARPRAVAVAAICADTDEEAMRLSASVRMMMLMLFRGRPIAVPPVETALDYLKSEGVPFDSIPSGRRLITGSPAKCRAELERVAEDYGAEEVLVVTITYDHAARLRSYELIADALK